MPAPTNPIEKLRAVKSSGLFPIFDSSATSAAVAKTDAKITRTGPNRSIKRPTAMAPKARPSIEKTVAPDACARPQSNSSATGFRKMDIVPKKTGAKPTHKPSAAPNTIRAGLKEGIFLSAEIWPTVGKALFFFNMYSIYELRFWMTSHWAHGVAIAGGIQEP